MTKKTQKQKENQQGEQRGGGGKKKKKKTPPAQKEEGAYCTVWKLQDNAKEDSHVLFPLPNRLLESFLHPVSMGEFLSQFWKTKAVSVLGGGVRRVEPIADLLFGGNLKKLLENSPSQAIHVWMKPLSRQHPKDDKQKEETKADNHVSPSSSSTGCNALVNPENDHKTKDSETRIESFQADDNQALLCHRAGASLYFRAPETLHDLLIPSFASRLFTPPACRFADGQRRGEMETFVSREGHVTGWHFDFMENFTVQVSGTKRWRLGGPWSTSPSSSVSSSSFTTIGGGLKDMRVRNPLRGATPHYATLDVREQQTKVNRDASPLFEFDPTHSSQSFDDHAQVVDLGPGDVLYFPAGMWHKVEALSDSLSINISLVGGSWAEFWGDALRQRLQQSETLRSSMDIPAGPPATFAEVQKKKAKGESTSFSSSSSSSSFERPSRKGQQRECPGRHPSSSSKFVEVAERALEEMKRKVMSLHVRDLLPPALFFSSPSVSSASKTKKRTRRIRSLVRMRGRRGALGREKGRTEVLDTHAEREAEEALRLAGVPFETDELLSMRLTFVAVSSIAMVPLPTRRGGTKHASKTTTLLGGGGLYSDEEPDRDAPGCFASDFSSEPSESSSEDSSLEEEEEEGEDEEGSEGGKGSEEGDEGEERETDAVLHHEGEEEEEEKEGEEDSVEVDGKGRQRIAAASGSGEDVLFPSFVLNWNWGNEDMASWHRVEVLCTSEDEFFLLKTVEELWQKERMGDKDQEGGPHCQEDLVEGRELGREEGDRNSEARRRTQQQKKRAEREKGFSVLELQQLWQKKKMAQGRARERDLPPNAAEGNLNGKEMKAEEHPSVSSFRASKRKKRDGDTSTTFLGNVDGKKERVDGAEASLSREIKKQKKNIVEENGRTEGDSGEVRIEDPASSSVFPQTADVLVLRCIRIFLFHALVRRV